MKISDTVPGFTLNKYSGPPIYGPPHQRAPLLCGQKMEARTLLSLNLPLTSGHPSNAASGHYFGPQLVTQPLINGQGTEQNEELGLSIFCDT